METFTSKERFNNKKEIEKLFSQGKNIVQSPFYLLWQASPLKKNQNELELQILITVPKKNIKLASKRNIVKRRIKESFRKNKKKLYSILAMKSVKINIVLIYQKKEIDTYLAIDKKIKLILNRLIEKL